MLRMNGWRGRARERRAKRALERQLAYIQAKAERLNGKRDRLIEDLTARSQALRERLQAVRPFGPDVRLLEVGSGVTGHVFFFGPAEAVGVDPLADHFRAMFPAWHDAARTVAAGGESLPFPDGAFDLVISDNVVDHAENPRRIVEEMTRVLRGGGLLYFTVNVHHPLYSFAAALHSLWKALRLPGEVGPFADHTVHLTPAAASGLFRGLPLEIVGATADIAEAKRAAAESPPRHAGDRLKRLFYKNAVFELVAVRTG